MKQHNRRPPYVLFASKHKGMRYDGMSTISLIIVSWKFYSKSSQRFLFEIIFGIYPSAALLVPLNIFKKQSGAMQMLPSEHDLKISCCIPSEIETYRYFARLSATRI